MWGTLLSIYKQWHCWAITPLLRQLKFWCKCRINCNWVDRSKTQNYLLTSTNYIITGLAIKLVDCFISCLNWKDILENGQTLPKQLACEHAKDKAFLSGESLWNCMGLSYTHYSVCVYDLSQLSDYSWLLWFFINLRRSYVSVPAEISCSLAPNNKETLYITVLCFRFLSFDIWKIWEVLESH